MNTDQKAHYASMGLEFYQEKNKQLKQENERMRKALVEIKSNPYMPREWMVAKAENTLKGE